MPQRAAMPPLAHSNDVTVDLVLHEVRTRAREFDHELPAP
jgi:hypothetical protein